MTTQEFDNEFEILYNEVATNAAPKIDRYEKSVYLTKAQLEVVKNRFKPEGNKYQDGFEMSSKRRADLKELIKNFSTSTSFTSTVGLSSDSQFFYIPNEVFLPLQEQVIISDEGGCFDGDAAEVVPKTHDEYNKQIKNPFKKPSNKVVWRLDFSKQGGNQNVELICPFTVGTYQLRYVQYPEPIVLVDLDTEFPGEGLTIDGVDTEQTCQLDVSIHREILDRAVELATVDYRPEMASTKIQVNTRNE